MSIKIFEKLNQYVLYMLFGEVFYHNFTIMTRLKEQLNKNREN